MAGNVRLVVGEDAGFEAVCWIPSTPVEVRKGLGLSGLPPGEILGERTGEREATLSAGGRGDKGTFQRLASSGRSSPSSSSHSASSSFTDFLLGCQEPRLMGTEGGLFVEEEEEGLLGGWGFAKGLCNGGLLHGEGDLERL